MATLSFVDESTAGERSAAWPMEIFDERLTLREIIRKRIFQRLPSITRVPLDRFVDSCSRPGSVLPVRLGAGTAVVSTRNASTR
jgi:hypothetical protein